MPVYNSNIPQPTDQLSVSQGDLLDNFQAIMALIDVNHVDFASADQGKHNLVEMPVQAVAPAIAAGEVGLFNLLPVAPFPLTGVNEMFLQKSNGTKIPITASSQTANGWSYLPSGLLIKWGETLAANPGANTIVFPVGVGIPAFANIFQILLTPVSGNPAATFTLYYTGTITPFTDFTMILNASVGQLFTYLAIGI